MDSPHSQREVKSPARGRFSHKSIWIAHCGCLSLSPLACAGLHRWHLLNYSPQIMVSWSGDSCSQKFPPLLTLVPMAQSIEPSGEPTQLPGAKTRDLSKSQEPENLNLQGFLPSDKVSAWVHSPAPEMFQCVLRHWNGGCRRRAFRMALPVCAPWGHDHSLAPDPR